MAATAKPSVYSANMNAASEKMKLKPPKASGLVFVEDSWHIENAWMITTGKWIATLQSRRLVDIFDSIDLPASLSDRLPVDYRYRFFPHDGDDVKRMFAKEYMEFTTFMLSHRGLQTYYAEHLKVDKDYITKLINVIEWGKKTDVNLGDIPSFPSLGFPRARDYTMKQIAAQGYVNMYNKMCVINCMLRERAPHNALSVLVSQEIAHGNRQAEIKVAWGGLKRKGRFVQKFSEQAAWLKKQAYYGTVAVEDENKHEASAKSIADVGLKDTASDTYLLAEYNTLHNATDAIADKTLYTYDRATENYAPYNPIRSSDTKVVCRKRRCDISDEPIASNLMEMDCYVKIVPNWV